MMENIKPLRINHWHLHWSVHGMNANSFHFMSIGCLTNLNCQFCEVSVERCPPENSDFNYLFSNDRIVLTADAPSAKLCYHLGVGNLLMVNCMGSSLIR